MKRSSWFSTVFLPICLSAGLTIAAAAARVTAQTQPFDDLKEKFLKEVEGAKRRIAKNPNDAHEHYRLGGFYVKLYQFQDAVAAYSQALQLKPDFAYAHYALGWCCTRMHNYEEALKAHREAEKHIQITSFKLRLTGEEVNYAIGWDLYALRRYDEAIAHYLKAVQLNPKYQSAVYEIGRIHLRQGDQEGVQQIAHKLDPYLRELLFKEIEILKSTEKGGAADDPNLLSVKADSESRPTILYREKGQYTSMARDHMIEGTVILSVVYAANEKITGVRVLRELPYGLTAQALIAMQKIKFKPAMKDGKPISIRGGLEFGFNIY